MNANQVPYPADFGPKLLAMREEHPGLAAIEYARRLGALIGRSHHTVRRWIRRYDEENPAPLADAAMEEPRAEAEATDAGSASADRFDYDEDGNYVFALRGARPFTIRREVIRDMAFLFTLRGGNKTVREVLLLIEERHHATLTEDYALRILHAIGIYKKSPPHPPHMLEEHSADELRKLHLQKLQNEVELLARRHEARDFEKMWRRAIRDLSDQDRYIARLIEGMRAYEPSPPPARVEARDVPYMAILCAYDVHIGKRCIDGVDHSVEGFLAGAREIAETLADYGRLARAVVVFGGDFFHVDTMAGTTTAGTPQDLTGTPARMLFAGVDAAIRYIDIIRSVADHVRIEIVSGNHDELMTFALAKCIELHYAGEPSVEYHLAEHSRAYLRFGSSLIGFEHGDGPKRGDLGAIMAAEMRGQWGETRHSYWFTGHLHYESISDQGGATVIQCRTLAGADRWHHKKGYVLAKPAHEAHLFCPRRGRFGHFSASP